MIINYFGITEKGNFRSHNEDSMYASGEIVAGNVSGSFSSSGIRDSASSPLIFALADGMGGHISGEVASRMTLEKLAWTERAVQPLEELPHAGWQSLFSIINHEINDHAKATGKLGMGATLVGICSGKERYSCSIWETVGLIIFLPRGSIRLRSTIPFPALSKKIRFPGVISRVVSEGGLRIFKWIFSTSRVLSARGIEFYFVRTG